MIKKKTPKVTVIGPKYVYYTDLPDLNGEIFVFMNLAKDTDRAIYFNDELKIRTLIFENQIMNIKENGQFPKRIRLFKNASNFRVSSE